MDAYTSQRRVDVRETRAELRRLYGGEDDFEFREYLAGWFYDLHYVPLPSAQPFSFGTGSLWRIAIDYPDCPCHSVSTTHRRPCRGWRRGCCSLAEGKAGNDTEVGAPCNRLRGRQ